MKTYNLKRSLSFIKLKQQGKPLRSYSLKVLQFFLVILNIIIYLSYSHKSHLGAGEIAQHLRACTALQEALSQSQHAHSAYCLPPVAPAQGLPCPLTSLAFMSTCIHVHIPYIDRDIYTQLKIKPFGGLLMPWCSLPKSEYMVHTWFKCKKNLRQIPKQLLICPLDFREVPCVSEES